VSEDLLACSFCSECNPQWKFGCRLFKIPGIEEPVTALVACERCAKLVRAEDWAGLAEVIVETKNGCELTRLLGRHGALGATLALVLMFDQRRTGEVREIGNAAAE
jgi:hypothetical protein